MRTGKILHKDSLDRRIAAWISCRRKSRGGKYRTAIQARSGGSVGDDAADRVRG